MLSSAELHTRGLEASNAGRHALARRLLDRALERSTDAETTARILLSLAHVRSELGGRDEGLALCARALDIADLPAELTGLVQSQRGLLLMRAGDTADALDAFADAIRLLGSEPEPLTRVHLNRGNVFLQRGEWQRAMSDFEAALHHAARAGLEVQQAKAQHNLGYALLGTGDLVAALQMMEQAQATLSPLSLVSEAVGQQDRAEVLIASGMVQEASAALRSAATAFGARGLRQQQAEAELVLARLLLADEPGEAARIARRARSRFSRRGSGTWAVRAEAVAVSADLAGTRRRGDVTARADEIAAELSQRRLDREAHTLSLWAARALALRGDTDGACAHLAAAKVSRHSPLTMRLLAREVQAIVSRHNGLRTNAVRHLRRGLDDLHAWQSSFGSLDLQSSLVGHGRGLALQGLELALHDGRPAVVFEWSERARALASRVPPLRPPANEQAAADLAELRRVQSEIQHAELRGSAPKNLLRHADQLRDTIRQHAWYDEGSGVVTQPALLDEVVTGLAASGGSLVSYLVVDGQVHALVVTEQETRLVWLGPFALVAALLAGMRADLDMAAGRFVRPIADTVRASLGQRLRLLADRLVTPVRDSLDDRPVAVVPAGRLAGVPWTLLPGLRARPLTVPRSASSWLAVRAEASVASTAGFVAGPRVARAAEETSRTSAAWDSAVVLDEKQASAAAVHSLASNVDLLHVAAHGRHSADNPLFSGLELADGPWYGYDIDQIAAVPTTVILSACEVGRSSVRWGEETVGMTVAWLHAGARTVIASPASVNDDVACEVLAATHVRLAAGQPPSMALADATEAVAAESPAAFICFGSGW